jgi:leucyl/phenylalanyl-tRNA--protein transferase
VEIPRRRYRTLLDKAIDGAPADFMRLQPSIGGEEALAIVAERN